MKKVLFGSGGKVTPHWRKLPHTTNKKEEMSYQGKPYLIEYNEESLLARRGGGKNLDRLADWLIDYCPFRNNRPCSLEKISKATKGLPPPMFYKELKAYSPCDKCHLYWDSTICNADFIDNALYERLKQELINIIGGKDEIGK